MSQSHYIKNDDDCQVEFLCDKNERGRERPWRVQKLNSQYVAMAYEDVNLNKSERIFQCADVLLFSRSGDKLKLKRANFCRVRLCPMCCWRRSLKVHSHMTRILEAAKSEHYAYIMATFTMQNCKPSDLKSALDSLLNAYKKLVKRARISRVWRGWYRGVEITHNKTDDTFHPHIHALIAVDKRYFKGKDYIKQSELTELWRSCLGVNYTPIVDVRKTYGSDVKTISEVAKYSTKTSDIIDFDDWSLTLETVRVLDNALNNRRLVAFGGVFKELHAKLNLDDEEQGDLVRVDETSEDVLCSDKELLYFWHSGYSSYVKGGQQ